VAERELQGIDADRFLPYEASFERFAPHYAQWVHERDAAGAVWLEGESDRKVAPAELEGVVLQGRIDRIDRVAGEQGRARQLIDYKTASLQSLRNRVREPLEDTQLAFYAALEALREEGTDEPLEAVYLALDDSQGIKEVPHPEVARSAGVLLQNLADELRQLRAGAPLPALGEGMVCEHCEARGLCRRDHWSDAEEPGA
jgi:ATP-dependent helicase/nuclease subunit B